MLYKMLDYRYVNKTAGLISSDKNSQKDFTVCKLALHGKIFNSVS